MSRTSTTGRRYRPWQAATVMIAAFAANGLVSPRGTAGPPRPPGTPPDWVFLVAWPLLKLSASAADLRIANQPRLPHRTVLLRQRSAEWVGFATFTAVGPRTGRPRLILASTAAQAGSTIATARRVWPHDRRAALLLSPQACWLLYATALTVYGAALTVASADAGPSPRRGEPR